jgi:hypothetical protein
MTPPRKLAVAGHGQKRRRSIIRDGWVACSVYTQ